MAQREPYGRTHARMIAALSKNVTSAAHDAIIAATAVHYGYGLLTRNVADFESSGVVSLNPWEP